MTFIHARTALNAFPSFPHGTTLARARAGSKKQAQKFGTPPAPMPPHRPPPRLGAGGEGGFRWTRQRRAFCGKLHYAPPNPFQAPNIGTCPPVLPGRGRFHGRRSPPWRFPAIRPSRQDSFHCHWAHLGPRSTWFQSDGIPVSGSGGDPPPHLSPQATAAAPNSALTTLVTAMEGKRSAPIAGQVVCVERFGSAAGRPSLASWRCFSGERYPEMI